MEILLIFWYTLYVYEFNEGENMKKYNVKKTIKYAFCILILSTCFNFISIEKINFSNLNRVYADETNSYVGGNFDYNLIPQENFTGGEKINAPIKRIYAILILIFQMASVGGVIFAGVRYMYASADQKADIKQSMIHLVIGMIIVFCASTVVGIVTGTFGDLIGS